MEKSVIAIFGLILFSGAAIAANYEVALKGNEKILVNVPQAVLQITANPSLKTVKVQLSGQAQSDYVVDSEAGRIEIKKKESLSKEVFANYKPEGKFQIDIQAPSVPLEIHMFDGQVNLTKWSKEALVQVQKGKMVFRDGNGSLAIHSLGGDISIFNHQGRLDLDAYKVQLNIKELAGDANIENFAGDSSVTGAKGFISISQNQGSSKVTESSGTLKFDIGKSTLSSQGFSGRVEGQTQEGPVNVVMASETEVNVKSQSARVTIHSAKGSGASVHLSSVEGDISGPSYLKLSRDGGQKSLRGRLNGDVQKGSISVRSQEGSIVLR